MGWAVDGSITRWLAAFFVLGPNIDHTATRRKKEKKVSYQRPIKKILGDAVICTIFRLFLTFAAALCQPHMGALPHSESHLGARREEGEKKKTLPLQKQHATHAYR